ncbi:MAG: gamma-glutamylcyclotransferase family protein [Solirubrobacterales bacterium]
MLEPEFRGGYVFAYGSLVASRDPLPTGDRLLEPVPGRLSGFRLVWGAAMANRDAAPAKKHFVDPRTRRAPDVRIAFLDVEESAGGTVQGLAIPVDAARLAVYDAREVNYFRIDVSAFFAPALPLPVFAYRGTDEARERCQVPPEDPPVCVSAGYLEAVRQAFGELGPDSLAEFERTAMPTPFQVRPLDLVRPECADEQAASRPAE